MRGEEGGREGGEGKERDLEGGKGREERVGAEGEGREGRGEGVEEKLLLMASHLYL